MKIHPIGTHSSRILKRAAEYYYYYYYYGHQIQCLYSILIGKK